MNFWMEMKRIKMITCTSRDFHTGHFSFWLFGIVGVFGITNELLEREHNDYLVQAGTTIQGISPAGIATPNSVARGELLTSLFQRQSVGTGFRVDIHPPPCKNYNCDTQLSGQR